VLNSSSLHTLVRVYAYNTYYYIFIFVICENCKRLPSLIRQQGKNKHVKYTDPCAVIIVSKISCMFFADFEQLFITSLIQNTFHFKYLSLRFLQVVGSSQAKLMSSFFTRLINPVSSLSNVLIGIRTEFYLSIF